MRPQIKAVLQSDGRHLAYLVDADSVFVRNYDGQQRTHYATAISLGPCRAGQIELAQPDAQGRCNIISPMPRVFAVLAEIKDLSLAARGIDKRAAVVMLGLAASVQNIEVKFNGSQKISFGNPVMRSSDPDILTGATIEKMLAAWNWSAWKRNKTSGEKQHADMVAIGYRGTPENLRQLLSDLGLVATKKP
jgi:hypothetical protein